MSYYITIQYKPGGVLIPIAGPIMSKEHEIEGEKAVHQNAPGIRQMNAFYPYTAQPRMDSINSWHWVLSNMVTGHEFGPYKSYAAAMGTAHALKMAHAERNI